MEFYSRSYLENYRLIGNGVSLVLLFGMILFFGFLMFRWFKGSISVRGKQISLLFLILVLLFGLLKISEFQDRNNQEKISKNTASVIKGLSEKFNVSEDEIYVNTKEITEHTVYKIKDKFYQIHWVNNSILVEEMKVPYIDDIKILDGNGIYNTGSYKIDNRFYGIAYIHEYKWKRSARTGNGDRPDRELCFRGNNRRSYL